MLFAAGLALNQVGSIKIDLAHNIPVEFLQEKFSLNMPVMLHICLFFFIAYWEPKKHLKLELLTLHVLLKRNMLEWHIFIVLMIQTCQAYIWRNWC